MRVLVVDDSAVARRAVREVAFAAGATVTEAATVDEARDALVVAPPDAVVTDFDLPDGTGLEIARAARIARRAMPVAFLTSDRDSAYASGAASMGPVFSKLEPLAPLHEWLTAQAAPDR